MKGMKNKDKNKNNVIQLNRKPETEEFDRPITLRMDEADIEEYRLEAEANGITTEEMMVSILVERL